MNNNKKYSFDINLNLFKVKEPLSRVKISNRNIAIEQFHNISELDREGFFVLTLNAANMIINKHMVSLGTINAVLVHPREVFKAAILDGAATIIAVHNHPGGNPSPSEEDKKITIRLKKAGKIIGIKLLDHVIIGWNSSYSFQEEGEL